MEAKVRLEKYGAATEKFFARSLNGQNYLDYFLVFKPDEGINFVVGEADDLITVDGRVVVIDPH